MSFLSKIFGSYSEREVKKLQGIADNILAMDGEMAKLTDDELKAKTIEFRERYEKGESLDHILPEAFAVCREAAWRVLGMKHYREQLIGGMVLHQGRIAEMKTGEGKTLVATLPAYLNGLTHRGVHVVTVNDYLAKRDMEWMGQVYQFLGLTTGVIVHGLSSEQRRENYSADITYGTNNEFGFDYLRDNMVIYKEERVQRGLVFSIVDEVDSILVDEARTPLIISGAGEKSTKFYNVADNFVKQLREEDYAIDEKANAVMITESGMERAEKFFNIENYADADHLELQHYITQALKANYGMKIDKDYMVKDEQVIIVDEFTGRLMEGRRYSDGLHQAIEAKEGVKIERESKTLATITFQNYFRMYEKLSGMTGTALTEENEFREIYALDVIVIPTHQPIARIDRSDAVYKSRDAKFKAIIEEIKESHEKGQPVLVGTVSIEQSEYLSALLKKSGVRNHQILNAKYHEQEAEIISHAGELGMITIATNMAGRGTDIKLGEGVVEAGGLKIIGTERHESRRIDNQLRGRSGRQGDPGESRFFISLEDDLMRIFGSERYEGLFDKIGLEDENIAEDGKSTAKMLSRAIESAQKKVEGHNFEIRKNLIGYDDVMNMQREVIYRQRAEVLEGKNLKEQVETMINEIIDEAVTSHLSNVQQAYEVEVKNLILFLEGICLPHGVITVEDIIDMEINEIKAKLLAIVKETYAGKEAEFGEEHFREIERVVLLRVVDQKWMAHIDNMDHLKQGIGLRAYKQQDPTQAYQMEGSAMFEEMIEGIKFETIKFLFHIQPERPVERERVAEEASASHAGTDDKVAKKEPVKKERTAGRNDQCPCGSGKKYKNCCGRE